MLFPFRQLKLEELKQWWQIGVDFVEAPTDTWCRYVCDNDNVQCLCSIEDGRITAYSQADMEGRVGNIAVITSPSLLRQGFGSKHLRDAERYLSGVGVRRLVASIEIGNSPSLAFFGMTTAVVFSVNFEISVIFEIGVIFEISGFNLRVSLFDGPSDLTMILRHDRVGVINN